MDTKLSREDREALADTYVIAVEDAMNDLGPVFEEYGKEYGKKGQLAAVFDTAAMELHDAGYPVVESILKSVIRKYL